MVNSFNTAAHSRLVAALSLYRVEGWLRGAEAVPLQDSVQVGTVQPPVEDRTFKVSYRSALRPCVA